MLKRFGSLYNRFKYYLKPLNIFHKKTNLLKKTLVNFTIFNLFLIWNNNQIIIQNQHSNTNNQIKNQSISQLKQFQIPKNLLTKINKNKIILVMDLDQTMVFTRRKKPPSHHNFITLMVNQCVIYVQFRPYISQFLLAASQLFTIYVYTAGNKTYADAVINALPNGTFITKRFYRESCIQYRGDIIKDLNVIKKSIDENEKQKIFILVDDNGLSINYNRPFSIRIHPFQGDQQDKCLLEVFQKLINFYTDYIDGKSK